MGTWWLLIAIAFILPLLEGVIGGLLLGLLPLPYGTAYPDQVQSAPTQYVGHATVAVPSPTPEPNQDQPRSHVAYGHLTVTGITKFSEVHIYWDSITPMVALALGWAYLADRKKRGSVLQG